MGMQLYIGTSGWHYNDWTGLFYPIHITWYHELEYHARYYNTVENNSSFYRIASEVTYKTWDRYTPEGYKFSLKLNKFITHTHHLELTDEVKERINYILTSTQVLKQKLGAILIQLPASFHYDPMRLKAFVTYFSQEVLKQQYPLDIAIEFRNKDWFTNETFALLEEYNIALVAGQSSRWPEVRKVTAQFAYIRMHGPEKLFASPYSSEQLQEWADYITEISTKVSRTYVYFNNDFHGYALKNATELSKLLH